MSELLNKENEKCSENLGELKNTINAIDYLLSDEDSQNRAFTINDLFLKDKDLGNRCAKLLVQQGRCLYRVFIRMLLRETNIDDDCLKYLLCENDVTDIDLQVVEKDGAVHISFSEIDTINCQSLVNFTDQFLKVIGVTATPLLKDFGSYTKTSSSDNVDDTLGVPECKGDREDNDDTDSNDSLVFFTPHNPENEESGSTTSQECKDLDESTLHDSKNNISYHEKKLKEGINIDHTDGDDSYDFSSYNSENESATTSQACKYLDKSALYDDSVVPRSDNSENEESGSTTSQECKDLDKSSLHDSKNNISYHEKKKVKEGSNNDHNESPQSNEEGYTFESFRKIVLQKYNELDQYYQKNLSSLKCKVVIVYTDTKGDFKSVTCGSNREANLIAYSLKDISKDPFPVVFIKNTDAKSSNPVLLKRMKASCSKVGQKETPSIRGTLHNALGGEQWGFPMSFKLDTGADSGSVGYNYHIIQHFILTVATINGDFEPAILCKVKSDTIATDGVQVFDIDGDPNWNAIGLSILTNYIIYLDIKNGRVEIGKHDDVAVEDTEEKVLVTFEKQKH